LSEEFDVLTESFSLAINVEAKIYLDYLIIVIDEVDHCGDYLGNDKTNGTIPMQLNQPR